MYVLSKEALTEFLKALMASHELIAPVKTDLVRFSVVEKPEDVVLDKSYYPLKEFFFRKEETLFSFDNGKVSCSEVAPKSRVFFGLKKCDLNAIQHQDMVFIDDAPDNAYKTLRKHSFLIGVHCNEPCSENIFPINLLGPVFCDSTRRWFGARSSILIRTFSVPLIIK